jgi:hypothetical protein
MIFVQLLITLMSMGFIAYSPFSLSWQYLPAFFGKRAWVGIPLAIHNSCKNLIEFVSLSYCELWSEVMPNNGMEGCTCAGTTRRECAYCLYFKQDEWGSGYCSLHHMYVLRTFDCPKFTPNDRLPEDEHSEDGGNSEMSMKQKA